MKADDPRIRPPYQDNTAEILLLKAILNELQAPPVRRDHSEAIMVLLASILEELRHLRRLVDVQIVVENDNG
jgi:hypothetical protein